jgi:hypothetical protein
MKSSYNLAKAQKYLYTLEFIEALESSFIIGLCFYLGKVITLSYMLNIIHFIFTISLIFLFSSLEGIYKYHRNKIA